MMLGYLLARAGVEVVVLEKHADFLRDFRGDTVHPSTLETMHSWAFWTSFSSGRISGFPAPGLGSDATRSSWATWPTFERAAGSWC